MKQKIIEKWKDDFIENTNEKSNLQSVYDTLIEIKKDPSYINIAKELLDELIIKTFNEGKNLCQDIVKTGNNTYCVSTNYLDYELGQTERFRTVILLPNDKNIYVAVYYTARDAREGHANIVKNIDSIVNK